MPKYRNDLPQLSDRLFITDGGMETTFVFHNGIDLPHFAAFDLLKNAEGTRTIRNYYGEYVRIAKKRETGFILETATWRASPDWAALLGYSKEKLAWFNRKSVELVREIRNREETAATPMVISGAVGPRGDGYDPGHLMSADEAEAYHAVQIGTFAETEADMISAIPMPRKRPASPAPHVPLACLRRSRSRSRPTAACRPARTSDTPSNRSMPTPQARPPTT